MGNTSSQAPSAPASRTRPLKHTKRSIVDHPQLAAPSDPIPIPALPGQPPPPRPTPPPAHADSFAVLDVPDLLGGRHDSLHTHKPIQYNSTRSFGGVRRGGVQGRAWQEDPPQHPPQPPPPKKMPPMDEIVRSSIPLRIHEPRPRDDDDDKLPSPRPDPAARSDRLVPAQVVWRDGGSDVILAGTFDDLEWRARKRMRYDPTSGNHLITLRLLPGTYRLKFIVDGIWRCSDDMPTATDDGTGNLVNYVDVDDPSAVDLGSGPDAEERQCRDARVMKANRRRTYPLRHTGRFPTNRSPTTSRTPFHPPLLPPSESSFWGDVDSTHPDYDQEHSMEGWERGRDGVLEKWTSAIPEPLIAAAQQEEAYLAAVAAQRAARRGGAGVRGSVSSLGLGFPNIPPAPRLPRHLDKVILNAKTHHSSSSSSRSGKHKSRSGLGMTSLLPPLDALAAGSGPALRVEGGSGSSGKLMENMAQADDSSVLPVPSHVVLHHLGTSAIKNSVLAVSDTTRYNKKYITTIYYKPT